MAQWVPISLDVEAGAFVLPLIDFADKGELAPLPERPRAKDLTDAVSGALNTTVDSTFSVGLFGMADTDGKTHWDERSWDFVNTHDTVAKAEGKTGYTLRWGVGFRIHVQNSKLDSKVQLTDRLPIAWASELGLSQVSYAIEMFGLSEPAALEWLPTPGVFDAQTVLSLDTHIRDTVSKALLAPDPDLKVRPVPLSVQFQGPYARLAVNKALSVAFAVSSIAKNLTKEAALAKAKAAGERILVAEVARVYDVWQATGAPGSDAFKLARQTARMWLDDSEAQDPLSRAIGRRYTLGQPVSADGAGSASDTDYDRIVLRSQSVASTTAQKLGFGDITSVDGSGDTSKLVYELFLRKALQGTSLQDGVSRMRGEFSGFRLVASLQHVDSKLKANFAAVSAASALGLAQATFELQNWGMDPKVTAGLLQKSAFSESEFPSVRAALGEAKAQVATDPSLLRPEVTEFVAGTDSAEHSFPGARLIYLALKQLRKERKSPEAQAFADKLGFEKSHMSAVYDFFWDNPSPSVKPPDEVRDEAERLLELTEPKG
ncbi:hypothetical protein [Hyalangium sp.]|uniref:hypothetical protein n=1 Tax=Hyalangium sp. TaxID=2028555 RepID=UPI002D30A1F9|nr:hypothetical protein [Hyalangium sp.]HYI00533.1 hypothetical protein [Hyalangium sp.]